MTNSPKDFFSLSPEQEAQLRQIQTDHDALLSSHACASTQAVRKYSYTNKDNLRSPFAVDCDKIVHSLYYNRYTDKTQVFSFHKNDDITRRALHVQLVSRIGRTLGKALGLNLELIEAIALGHDMGHTPFGHRGETYLDELYRENTGRRFNHNVHSVRVFNNILNLNLTLQTLDGILCHNGEKAFARYEPSHIKDFERFEAKVERAYTDEHRTKHYRPSTLEGCVVRVSDMIAYVGKDRQDAKKADFRVDDLASGAHLGGRNLDIVQRIIQNIVKNSIGQPYLSMDEEIFEDLKSIQADNFEKIYNDPDLVRPYDEIIRPMMRMIYQKLVEDFNARDFDGILFRHYLNHWQGDCYRDHPTRRFTASAHDIVTDFIASMTDDYFLDLFRHLFPGNRLSEQVRYVPYF